MEVKEKIEDYGIPYLSDKELIKTVLNYEIGDNDVNSILYLIDSKGCTSNHKVYCDQGIDNNKAVIIAAFMELGRRIFCPGSQKISFPQDILPIVRHYVNRKQEYFLCLSLNGAQEVIAVRVVTIGTLTRTCVHPREVFADAITDRAASIICAHNHPSGNVQPSNEDRDVTSMIKKSGDILGIKLLDHVIFSETNYYSFQEQGEL